MPSVGSLYATLTVDDQQYQDAMKKAPGIASQTAAKINTSFARNPGIDNAAKAIAGLTGDLKIQAGALGVTAAGFDRLSAAGSSLGVTQAQIVRTFAGLRGQLDLARAGVEPNVAAFRELGLNWRSLARARPEAALAQVAQATFLAGEGTKAYNTGLRILGADGLPRAQNFFRQLARGDLPAVAAAAGKTGESFTRGLGPAITSTFLRVAGPVALLSVLKSLSTQTLALGANLKQQASALGLTASRYQTLEFVARENDAAAQDLISSTSQLRIALRNASDGSETDRRKFEDLGLSWRELIKLSPDEALERVARATRTADTDTRVFGAGARLLGTDTFPKLRGALAAIADQGLPALDAALEKSGGKLSDDYVRRLNEVEKTLQRFGRSLLVNFAKGADVLGILPGGLPDPQEITAADRALNRLADSIERVQKLGPAAPVAFPRVNPVIPLAGIAPIPSAEPAGRSALEELQAARLDFAKVVADSANKAKKFEIDAAQQALSEYRKSLSERETANAATVAEIIALEYKLASRRDEFTRQAAANQAKAAADRVAAEKAAEEQRAAIVAATTKRVTDITAEGERKRAFEALSAADKIVDLEKRIADARRIKDDTAAESRDREQAAQRLNTLSDERAALLTQQAEEAKRLRTELEGQADALKQSLFPLERYRNEAARINKLHDAGLLSLGQWDLAIKSAQKDLADANIDNLVKQLNSAANTTDAIASAVRAVGNAGLSNLRDKAGIAGTAGNSRTQRSIESNLAKAEAAAARGNTGASDQFLRRAQELARNVGGTTAANVLGSQVTGLTDRSPRRIDASSNEGHAIANAQRLAEFTAGRLPNLAPATILTPASPPSAAALGAAQASTRVPVGAAPGSPTGADTSPKSSDASLSAQVAELVKALTDIAGRLETD